MLVPEIPSDIFDLILGNLHLRDKETLQASSLVCRRFVCPSQKRLFLVTAVLNRRHHILLANMLSHSPHIANYIRGITSISRYIDDRAPWNGLSSALTALNYLALTQTYNFPLSVLSNLQNLKHLSLNFCSFAPNNARIDSVATLAVRKPSPQLRTLQLYLKLDNCQIFIQQIVDPKFRQIDITGLRRLQLFIPDGVPNNIQQIFEISSSSLEELELIPPYTAINNGVSILPRKIIMRFSLLEGDFERLIRHFTNISPESRLAVVSLNCCDVRALQWTTFDFALWWQAFDAVLGKLRLHSVIVEFEQDTENLDPLLKLFVQNSPALTAQGIFRMSIMSRKSMTDEVIEAGGS